MRILRLLALLLMLASPPAQAFFDPPYVTPAQPQVGDTVYMNIRGGECDAIFDWPGDPDLYPQMTQEGNAITILWFGSRETDPLFCGEGIGTPMLATLGSTSAQISEPKGRHPGESRDPAAFVTFRRRWVPAFAGTTSFGIA